MSQQTATMAQEVEEAQRGRQLIREPAGCSPRQKKSASEESRTLRGRGRRRSTSPFISISSSNSQGHSPASKSRSGSSPPSRTLAKSQENQKPSATKDSGKIDTSKNSPGLGWPAKNIRSQAPSRSGSVGAPPGSTTTRRRRQRTRSRSRVHEGVKEKMGA
ncbi:uncharacterized protein BP5553_03197 [Venustampulla echinocandica]|uniref:Uncharacterized protein n=1 Tax=Venustampulla echinocandica TaxID=2656787 RepID=A0A370TTK0_9HELO|nr:uncharacterized protein BP5553_03197 [Venustampulla echinocandica]RDL38857.1 hypothetical protein BP5553_03197 [Venustampulla echinocandica]